MKYISTAIGEQETIINIDYEKQIISIYSSRSNVISLLTKVLGRPTERHAKNKSYWTGATWNIAFAEREKILKVLAIDSFVDSEIEIKHIEDKKKKVKKKDAKSVTKVKKQPKEKVIKEKKTKSTTKKIEDKQKVKSKKETTPKKNVVKKETKINKKTKEEKKIVKKETPKNKTKVKKTTKKETPSKKQAEQQLSLFDM